MNSADDLTGLLEEATQQSAPTKLVGVANCTTTADRLAAHFWARVDTSGGEDACWPWLRSVNTSGYGQYRRGRYGVRTVAHRTAYELARGPIANGLTIDHLCFTKRCCNPRHLDAVTMRVNVLRSNDHYGINSARTHCPSGHEYNEMNTRWYDGRRYCRACGTSRAPSRKGIRHYRVGNGAPINDGPADRSNALPVELNAGGW